MKIFWLIGLAALAAGCGNSLVIVNDCKGSWVRVLDGNGDRLVEYLEYGNERVVEVGGYAGSRIYLKALGYELGTERYLGSKETSISIPRFGNGGMGPSQIRPWQIDDLDSSDRNSGCQR